MRLVRLGLRVVPRVFGGSARAEHRVGAVCSTRSATEQRALFVAVVAVPRKHTDHFARGRAGPAPGIVEYVPTGRERVEVVKVEKVVGLLCGFVFEEFIIIEKEPSPTKN